MNQRNVFSNFEPVKNLKYSLTVKKSAENSNG